MKRAELCFAGLGGQGLILVGIIYAEAALLEGKKVTQTQSYGPEARGGASRSEVVISEEEIDYPFTSKLDLLLAMSQEAHDAYIGKLSKEGILIIDSTYVRSPNSSFRLFSSPFTKLARERLGREITANMIALGTATHISAYVSPEAVEEALLRRVPPAMREVNREAFKLGLELPRKL